MAVKVVSRERPGWSLDDRLLRREVDIGRRVAEGGSGLLLPVIDVAESSEALILVMARADRALGDVPVPLPEDGVVTVMADVAAGLRELHALGIIHRDLKPDNILFQRGRWKLADFGIARDQEIGTQDPTFLGWGSHPYMAPEIWEQKSPTIKTDLYALGCLAFELLAGVPPYPGGRDQARAGHLTEPPPDPPAGNSALRDLITRLIAKSPGDRPQDARAVLERLERAQAPRSPAQERIARSLARYSSDSEHAAASAASAAEAAEARRHQAAQGKAELRDIFSDVFEELEALQPDAAIRHTDLADPGSREICALAAGGAWLHISLWPYNPVPLPPGDPTIVLGWVFITNRRYGPDQPHAWPHTRTPPSLWDIYGSGRLGARLTPANLVYEPVGDRLGWQIYRFRKKQYVQQVKDKLYGKAVTDDAHEPTRPSCGLTPHDFQGYRKYILSRTRWFDRQDPISQYTVKVTRLTLTTALELFQEAIDLRPDPA